MFPLCVCGRDSDKTRQTIFNEIWQKGYEAQNLGRGQNRFKRLIHLKDDMSRTDYYIFKSNKKLHNFNGFCSYLTT